MENIIWLDGGGVTSAKGFIACGVYAGIKASKQDMAFLLSELPSHSAGLFTSNKVPAAPVLLDKERVANGRCRGVVINSGCANACTGQDGFQDAVDMAKLAADAFNVPEEEMLVCSTGTIGRRLNMDKIANGINLATMAIRNDGGNDAAHAIMTTDTKVKQVALKLKLGGVEATIGGMCKGAGMMCPNLATMLAFITTDANVKPDDLKDALKIAVSKSFNRITIDGDQSTNDTILAFSNGASGGEQISKSHPEWSLFTNALCAVAKALSLKIVEDGEGATKFVTVSVESAATPEDALAVAKCIANSPLFKTACFGGDPNWGRVICAAGNSGAAVQELKTQIYFDDVCVYDKGTVANSEAQKKLAAVMSNTTFTVLVKLNLGEASDTVYTCDFSYEYVKINGEYTT